MDPVNFQRPGDEGVYSSIDWQAVIPVVSAEIPSPDSFGRGASAQ